MNNKNIFNIKTLLLTFGFRLVYVNKYITKPGETGLRMYVGVRIYVYIYSFSSCFCLKKLTNDECSKKNVKGSKKR